MITFKMTPIVNSERGIFDGMNIYEEFPTLLKIDLSIEINKNGQRAAVTTIV